MKLNTPVKVLIASLAVVTTLSVNAKPSHADSTQFYCAKLSGQWNTFIKNSSVGRVALINYGSNALQGAGYNNQERCKTISPKFQKFYNRGQLTFKTGIVNRSPVICAVKTSAEKCSSSNQLFQLNPGQDSRVTLQRMINLRKDGTGQPIYLSGNDSLYTYDEDGELSVNVEKLIKSIPPQSESSQKP